MTKKKEDTIKLKTGTKLTIAQFEKLRDKPEDVQLVELIQAYVPNSFVIVISETDDMVAAYKLRAVNLHLQKADGKKTNLLKNLIKHTEEEVEDGAVTQGYEDTVNFFIMTMWKIILKLSKGPKKGKK